jgi:hypothetical protein
MKIKLTLIICIGIIVFFQMLGAQTWDPAIRLTWNSGGSHDPAIAIDSSSHIHAAWSDNTPGNAEIFYRKSTNGGASWAIKRLTWTSRSSIAIDLAIDSSDNVHVVWHELIVGWEIFHKKSTDGGASWSTKRLTWNGGFSWFPAIAFDSSDGIHVIYQDSSTGNYEIYYKKSTNGGVTWSSNKRLTWTPGSSYNKAIAIDSSDHIHVFFEDKTPGKFEIYHKKSTDGGNTWTTQRLTWTSEDSRYPDVAIDSADHIHLVLRNGPTGNYKIHYKKSTNGGSSWLSKKLSWFSGFSDIPAIAVDSNNYIHVVWKGDPAGNDEIYYKKSTTGGAFWSRRRLTWNSGRSWKPAIAIDAGDDIHVVWEDNTPGNDEIFYRKGIQ